MPIYQTTGQLTGTIERENVGLAQAYLTDDDMTQYVDEPLRGAIERVRWDLKGNGHDYAVEVVASRELNGAELVELAGWISGQNSDGLGEGFEQQDWAWVEDNDWEEDYESEDDYREDGHMISFDWKSNDCALTKVV